MEIKVDHDEQKPSLLQNILADTKEKSPRHNAISQTYHSTTHLAKHVPTGAVIVFVLLSPFSTNQGECNPVRQYVGVGVIALCSLACFFLRYTDSFKDKKRNICYGFVTFHGFSIIDGSEAVTGKYRLKVITFVHAFMLILVFATVVLSDQNVVKCFYPTATGKAKMFPAVLPIGIGVICSVLFIIVPTKHHGISYPLTDD